MLMLTLTLVLSLILASPIRILIPIRVGIEGHVPSRIDGLNLIGGATVGLTAGAALLTKDGSSYSAKAKYSNISSQSSGSFLSMLGASTQKGVKPLPRQIIWLIIIHPEPMDLISQSSRFRRRIVLLQKLGLKISPSGDRVPGK
ncbi:hypothetical protein E3N88_34569 [Mikania micrantha]|uniref:Uncharacterized protein n=1 Tax=Mikania micrantha TaxID=192012 RepID=A0A5N6LYH9_9ASTR|nr:hypothetical protein E3N88_34569 [Mikania micrantha]